MDSLDSTPSPDDGSAALRRRVMKCLDLLEREGSGAVERYLEGLPEEAPAIRERLATLQQLGLLEHGSGPLQGLPDRLGPFRLLERIGTGGMGVVYRAEQEPLGREVAVKIVRLDYLFHPGARERFRREVQAIARLKHPGIVSVFSGGEEGDIPYYAMELVDGCSLDQILLPLAGRNPQDLTGTTLSEVMAAVQPRRQEEAPPDLGSTWVETCLRLVVQTADALDHAHKRGVLHRDVKPSNLMVTGTGRLLLLDFGLAHTESGGTLTRSGSMLGSMPYMAPEQLRGHRSDARSDLYSLGVVLYELLALRQPFWAESLEGIRERVLAGGTPPLRTRNPGASWEVETVCLCAMELDPGRRYASAADLARDLRNVLEHRPIEARRPGVVLRARRTVERHPAWSVGLVLGMVLLAGAVVFGWKQFRSNRDLVRANTSTAQELRRREEINQILRGMLQGPDPWAAGQGRDVRMVDVLRRLEAQLAKRGDLDPIVEAEVKGFLGNTLASLGFLDDAEPLLERHLELQTSLHRAGDRPTLNARYWLASLRSEQGRVEEARDILEGCWIDCQQQLPATDSLSIKVLNDLALAEHGLGNVERAQVLYEQELALGRSLAPADPDTLATAECNLGALLIDLGQIEPAEAMLRESLALRERTYTAEHARTLAARMELVRLFQDTGRFPEAAELLEGVPELFDRVLGPGHVRTIQARIASAQVLMSLDRLEESEKLLREVLALPAEALDQVDIPRRAVQAVLSMVLVRQGRAAEADALSGEAYEDFPTSSASVFTAVMVGMSRGAVLAQLRRWPEAQEVLRATLDLEESKHTVTADHLQLITLLASVLEARGRVDEALELMGSAPAHDVGGKANLYLGILRFKYGQLLMDHERWDEAEVPLLDAYDIYRDFFGEDAEYTLLVVRVLIRYYDEMLRDDDAEEFRQKLAAAKQRD